jgi:uncharacterized protein YbjT (DUF2867 family)
MVGDGVLHECLADPRVTRVTAIGRSPLGLAHARLHEIQHADFFDYSRVAGTLATIDACFFCLGVSSAGMSEADYTRQTHDLALAAAQAVAAARPGATFCYVSGEGSDSSERGHVMWARVKGRTENAILALPLQAYMFRPGFIRPRPGKASKTAWYRALYAVLGPAYPLLARVAPRHVTTSENMGRAMIHVAASGWEKRVLENPDINRSAGVS